MIFPFRSGARGKFAAAGTPPCGPSANQPSQLELIEGEVRVQPEVLDQPLMDRRSLVRGGYGLVTSCGLLPSSLAQHRCRRHRSHSPWPRRLPPSP